MHILAVDDERPTLDELCAQLRTVVPGATIFPFQDGDAALAFVPPTAYDIAFVDIQLWGTDGLSVAKELLRRYPQINLIFTTGYQEYATAAFSLYASGYVMKPITEEKLRRELQHLRRPLCTKPHRVVARTFGNFELFIDGSPVAFRYTKTHELIAYLVDRAGALCTNGELTAILWEDGDNAQHVSYLKNLRADLISTLKCYGCEDILLCRRGRLGIVPEQLSCDYYNWRRGDNEGLNAYRGEYMSQYSWSEFFPGKL